MPESGKENSPLGPGTGTPSTTPPADTAPATENTENTTETTTPPKPQPAEEPTTPTKPKDTQTSGIAGVTQKPGKSTAEEMAELSTIQVDTAFANNTFNTLAGLPFDRLIGEPLRAAVKAQRDMAKEALNYIQRETIVTGKDGVGQIACVTLSFVKDGKETRMRVPLLTLIPYPSLTISSMTYKFTAKVDANSGVAVAVGADLPSLAKTGGGGASTSSSVSKGGSGGQGGGGGGGGIQSGSGAGAQGGGGGAQAAAPQKSPSSATLTGAISSKRDSAATRESRYSVETTIDLSITAGAAAPPSGITKIVDILEKSTETVNTDGVLDVSSNQLTLTDGHAVLRASYRDGKGIYRREKIKCSVFDGGKTPKALSSGDEVLLLFAEKGVYLVEADDFKELVMVS